MAEIKITCPNCFNMEMCFEDKLEIEDFTKMKNSDSGSTIDF